MKYWYPNQINVAQNVNRSQAIIVSITDECTTMVKCGIQKDVNTVLANMVKLYA